MYGFLNFLLYDDGDSFVIIWELFSISVLELSIENLLYDDGDSLSSYGSFFKFKSLDLIDLLSL